MYRNTMLAQDGAAQKRCCSCLVHGIDLLSFLFDQKKKTALRQISKVGQSFFSESSSYFPHKARFTPEASVGPIGHVVN
jgi:hypothetical protein